MLAKCYPILAILSLTGCTQMASLFQTVEDIATDEAAQAIVYKNAMQKDTDIRITIDVINKDLK